MENARGEGRSLCWDEGRRMQKALGCEAEGQATLRNVAEIKQTLDKKDKI